MDAVYAERDKLILFLARLFPSYLAPVDDAEPGWTMGIYVETPEGQLSWHIPDREIAWFSGFCPEFKESRWDGHTTEEKYERLSRLTKDHVVATPDYYIFDRKDVS